MTTLDLTFAVTEFEELEKSQRWDDLDQVEDQIEKQKILMHYAAKND